MNKLTTIEIENLLNHAVAIGNRRLKEGNAPAYSDSSVSEQFLIELLKDAATKMNLNPNIIKQMGAHAFPDVTIANSEIGIELKGTSSSRRFNGNSVIASTMIQNLKKVYLFCWIGASSEIGYRDYFECVSTPVVTHSPRFQLDIDLAPNKSMFGTTKDKVGSVENIIFSSKGIDSQKIIEWMTECAKSRGETPWWISKDESAPSGSTGLMSSTQLPPHQRRAFMKASFLAFPKILDRTSRNKYNGLFEWAITVKSILSSRDDFSAGGKVTVFLPKFSTQKIEVPKVIQVAIDSLSSNNIVYLHELEASYSRKFNDPEHFLKFYSANLPNYLTHIYPEVSKYDKNLVQANGFAGILAELLISKIDISTIK